MKTRRKLRSSGWLALIALGLQLTLSFGHIHAEDFQTNFAAANAAAAQNQTAPADNHKDGDQDDFCPICAVMHMAGTSLLPAAPLVGLPADIVSVVFVAVDLTALPPLAGQFFQARAPPQA